MRVVLDPSVLVAAYVTRAGVCAELYEEVLQRHDLVSSQRIMEEVRRMLRTRFLIGDELASAALAAMTRAAEVVRPLPVPDGLCRDPDDLPILGTAMAGASELLVTVDSDLLDLRSFESCEIVRPGEFWKRTHG